MDPVRVLLVEDDEDNRELMAEVLATSGFDVVSAASGRDGSSIAAAVSPAPRSRSTRTRSTEAVAARWR